MKKHILLGAILFFLVSLNSAFAQFLNVQIGVDPSLSTHQVQPLNFGFSRSNSGFRSIDAGDANSGIFSITSYSNQEIGILLDAPSKLQNISRQSNDAIPVDIKASYANSGVDDAKDAIAFDGNQAFFRIYHPGNKHFKKSDNTTSWKTAYIYLFGDVDVGPVPSGYYSGTLTMQIAYF